MTEADTSGSLGDMFLRLHADLSGYRRDMAQFENMTQDSMGKVLKQIMSQAAGAVAAVTAIATATGGLAGAVMTGLKFNAMLEQQEVAFGTLLNSADKAHERVQELAQFAAETPFQFPEIMKASKVLQTFGGDTLAAGAGLRVVGDAAAAIGEPINDVAYSMGHLFNALESGTSMGLAIRSLQLMGLIGHDTRMQLERAEGQTHTTAQAMEVMQAAFGKYSGAMINQSKTANGLMSTLIDNWHILTAELTKDIFGDVKQGLAGSVDNLQEFGDHLKVAVKGATELAHYIKEIASYGIHNPGTTIATGIGAALLASITNPGALAAFGAAIVALPAWAEIGIIVGAAAATAIVANMASTAFGKMIDAKAEAEHSDDTLAHSLAHQAQMTRKPEVLDLIQAEALKREKELFALSIERHKEDGKPIDISGYHDETVRIDSLMHIYKDLYVNLKDRRALVLKQNEDLAVQAKLAKAAADEEARKAAEARKLEEHYTKILGPLKDLEDTAYDTFIKAQYNAGGAGEKMQALKEEERVATALYKDRLAAAEFAKDEKAARAATLSYDTTLLDIAKKKKDLNREIEKSTSAIHEIQSAAYSRTGLGTGVEDRRVEIERTQADLLKEIRDLLKRGREVITDRPVRDYDGRNNPALMVA